MEIRIERPVIDDLGSLLSISPIAEHRVQSLSSGADVIGLVVGEETPIGYAHLEKEKGRWTVELAVHPNDRRGSLGAELLSGALDVVRTEGGTSLTYWQSNADVWSDEAALAVGFAQVREVVQLRVPLPIEEKSSLDLRPFRVGLDHAEWLAVNTRAFAGHPDQGTWTEEDLLDREREPWFDPAGFLILEIDGRMAGSCWTKVHASNPPDGPLGEIYVISVDPSFHRQGYGRSLVISGLEHLANAGIPTGTLYTESTNTAALTLYRSLGFERDHVDRAYTALPTA